MGDSISRGLCETAEIWKLQKQTEDMKAGILQAWKELELDVVIAPGFGIPAPLHEDPSRILPLTCWTNPYNVLNFPAGTVPVEVYSQEDKVRHVSPLFQKSLTRNTYHAHH